MFKLSVCVFLVAVSACCHGAAVNSGSTNTAMNVMSSGSRVVQNDVQNVDSGNAGLAGFAPFGMIDHAFLGHPGFIGHAGFIGQPGLFAPAAFAQPIGALGHYSGYDVNSQSSNTAANIGSSDSQTIQNNVQNTDQRY